MAARKIDRGGALVGRTLLNARITYEKANAKFRCKVQVRDYVTANLTKDVREICAPLCPECNHK